MRYERITEPLKYMGRAAFASLAFVGGMVIYESGCKNEELLLGITGFASMFWAMGEAGKNILLTIASFENNLEGRINYGN